VQCRERQCVKVAADKSLYKCNVVCGRSALAFVDVAGNELTLATTLAPIRQCLATHLHLLLLLLLLQLLLHRLLLNLLLVFLPELGASARVIPHLRVC